MKFIYGILMLMCMYMFADGILGAQSIHSAVLDGDLNAVQRAIDDGADVNSYNLIGFAPLHSAARGGYANITRLLLENGALPDIRTNTPDSDTALHIASLNGEEGVVRALLAYEISVNAQNVNGNTPLHEAAVFGSLGIVRLLLGSGADASITNIDGKTPRDVNTALFEAPKGVRVGLGAGGFFPFEQNNIAMPNVLDIFARVDVIGDYLLNTENLAFFGYGGSFSVGTALWLSSNPNTATVVSPIADIQPILDLRIRAIPPLALKHSLVGFEPFVQYALEFRIRDLALELAHSLDVGALVSFAVGGDAAYIEIAYRYNDIGGSSEGHTAHIGVGYHWWVYQFQ